MERILNRNEQAYKNMEAVAKMLEAFSRNGAEYKLEVVYLDFGQDWKWTTIVRYGFSECQILSPKDWELIEEAETAQDIANVVDRIRNGKYFHD